MRNALICYVLLLPSYLFAFASNDEWQILNSSFKHLLELNEKITDHFGQLENFIPSTKEPGPKEFLRSTFVVVTQEIIICHDLIGELIKLNTPKKPTKSKISKNKKKKKAPSLNKQKEKITKNLNASLKKIILCFNDYIYLQDKIGAEFHRVLFNLGPYLPASKVHIPLLLLQEDDAQKHHLDSYYTALMLIAPFENYTKHLIDFFDALKKAFPSVIIDELGVDLDDRLDDESITIFALKKKYISFFSKVKEISSSREPIVRDYLIFENIDQENKIYVVPFMQSKSKDLLWFLDRKEKTSKIYSNMKQAKNGFLFCLLEGHLRFDFYTSLESIRDPADWYSVEFIPKDGFILKGNGRFHAGHTPLLQTTVNFIEYDDIARLKAIIDEIKEEGFLTTKVMTECLAWLMSDDALAIGHSLPPFYPPPLLKIKRDRERNEQEIISAHANRNLKRQFEPSNLPSVRDYDAMLQATFEGRGSIGNRLFGKCLKWLIKQKNGPKNSHQKGSHLQLEGKKGEKTKTVVFPHGNNKGGLKKSQVRMRLKGNESFQQDHSSP